jgi:hypothetical protein
VTATLTPDLVVTDDELQVLSSRVGVQLLPVVLSLRPRHGTESALTEAADQATRTLTDRGLICHGEVKPELVRSLQALQRPDRELAMRLVTPDGTARITVVCQCAETISIRRIDNAITLDLIEGAARRSDAIAMLMRHLPSGSAAEISPVGAPLDAVSHALSSTRDAAPLSDRIRALGAEARVAMMLGSALASRLAFAEIVYYTLDVDTDRIVRAPAAVGVFYTRRGRIVGAPSASPSGQLWTTLKGGSDHAIKQAISQLVELAERWEES